MKKLICIKDIEEMEKQGQKTIYINNDTLVTAAAKDMAKERKIEFLYKNDQCCSENLCNVITDTASIPVSADKIDMDTLCRTMAKVICNEITKKECDK